MRGADLTDTKLSGAELHFANLRGAILKGVNLSGEDNEIAHPKGGMFKVKPASLKGAYLQGANLEGACLLGVNLSYTDFADAQLKYAQIGRKPGAERWEVTNLERSDLSYDQLKTMRLRPGILFGERFDIKKVKDVINEKASGQKYIFIRYYDLLDLAELMFELNPTADELKVATEWKEKAINGSKFSNALRNSLSVPLLNR